MDITVDGIVVISDCFCGIGYCDVLMLAVLTDSRWKLAATCCNTIRCWRDAVDRPSTVYTLHNAQQQHCEHPSNSGQQVSLLPPILLAVPAVCLLKIVALSCHPQRSVDR